jgi:6-phosphogluconolactonase/glucosamine-6-phosphate isomerase/deaminase
MQFLPAYSPQPAGEYVAKLIERQLKDGRTVLWLLSGGSAIHVAVAAAAVLEGQNLTGLTVSLLDERYGRVGHSASNWHQLAEAGFKPTGATLHPVLEGAPLDATAKAFEVFLATEFEVADFVLGLLGIGPDGHTSGILPHSPAVDAPGLAFVYAGPDYQRVTTTAAALQRLDEAVVFAAGEAKWPVLDRLETELPVAEQPAQILKSLPQLTVFTDRPQK